MLISLSLTVVTIGPAPANVNVSPVVTVSLVPLSAAISNVLVILAISSAILADVEVKAPDTLASKALVAISVANDALKLDVAVLRSASLANEASKLLEKFS